MDALTSALVRLLRRVDALEQRLDQIEKAPTAVPAEAPSASAPVSVLETPLPPPLEPALAPMEPAPALMESLPMEAVLASAPVEQGIPSPPPLREPAPLETRFGLTWINRIGAFTLVLFVGFFFKLAIDNEWIGEGGRVMLGVLAGFGALAAADRLWRHGQRVFAHGISGAGVAILYLSFYASFGFYHLVPAGLAFGLMVSATAMAGMLALRYDSRAIAALGLLGGYATPLLLSTGEDRPWVFFSYLALLNAGGLAVARRRGWNFIEWLAAACTGFLYAMWLDERMHDATRSAATVFALLFYGMFATSAMEALVLVTQAATPFAMPAIWPYAAPFGLGSLALAAAGLGIAAYRQWPRVAVFAFSAFWLAYVVWMDEAHQPMPEGQVFVLLLAAFALFSAWLPYQMLVAGRTPGYSDLVLASFNGIVFFGASYGLLHRDHENLMGLLAVAIAGVQAGTGYVLWTRTPEERRDPRPVMLTLGVTLTLLVLAAMVQFSGYRVTMAWTVELGAVAWIAARLNSQMGRVAALILGALVAGRLMLLDAWIYSPSDLVTVLFNARFLTFAAASAAYWLAAWCFQPGKPALPVFLAGHAALLAGLSLEVLHWAHRTAPAGDVFRFQSTAISVLFGAYAVAAIAGGVVSRSAPNRVVGLALIAFVVLKLYTFDVWRQDTVYRVAAFGILAALLLLTSYLYSRYGSSLETLWKDRKPEA